MRLLHISGFELDSLCFRAASHPHIVNDSVALWPHIVIKDIEVIIEACKSGSVFNSLMGDSSGEGDFSPKIASPHEDGIFSNVTD